MHCTNLQASSLGDTRGQGDPHWPCVHGEAKGTSAEPWAVTPSQLVLVQSLTVGGIRHAAWLQTGPGLPSRRVLPGQQWSSTNAPEEEMITADFLSSTPQGWPHYE